MQIQAKRQQSDQSTESVGTSLFGDVPQMLIDRAEVSQLQQLHLQILQIQDAAHCARKRDELASSQEYMSKIEDFRSGVGAIWLRLWWQIDKDIEKAQTVSASFWRCMWVSLVRRNLNPQKYYALCGTPSGGYGGLVTRLANLTPQDELVKRWNLRSWPDYVNEIWKTKNQLMEKEREYRDTAIAVAQIGLGVGGMLLGIIGLVLSFVLTILARSYGN